MWANVSGNSASLRDVGEVHILRTGDAITFAPATPQQREKSGTEPAQVVIVTRRILP